MRRVLTALALALACGGAPAFDSAAWLARVSGFADDAKRLEAAREKCGRTALEPAENVEIPFETWPDGTVKSAVSAKRARFFFTEGLVWGEGVRVRQFREDGSVESDVSAEDVLIDRNARTGWARGAAQGRYRADAELRGEDVYFDFSRRCLGIATNTVLRARGDELSSRGAVYDSENGVAMFTGGVKVRHDEKGVRYDLACDRAFAFFAGTNDLRKVVALGNVTVAGDGRSGACDKAVYLREGGRLTMYGTEAEPARLADNGERKGELCGTRIILWTESGQVEVVNSRITVETGGLRLPVGTGAR